MSEPAVKILIYQLHCFTALVIVPSLSVTIVFTPKLGIRLGIIVIIIRLFVSQQQDFANTQINRIDPSPRRVAKLGSGRHTNGRRPAAIRDRRPGRPSTDGALNLVAIDVDSDKVAVELPNEGVVDFLKHPLALLQIIRPDLIARLNCLDWPRPVLRADYLPPIWSLRKLILSSISRPASPQVSSESAVRMLAECNVSQKMAISTDTVPLRRRS